MARTKLLLPNGVEAKDFDPIMVLAMWADKIGCEISSTKVPKDKLSNKISHSKKRNDIANNSCSIANTSSQPSNTQRFISQNNKASMKRIRMITAGMGKPTAHINQTAVEVGINYWKDKQLSFSSKSKSTNLIKHASSPQKSAVDYCIPPQGKLVYRKRMAKTLSTWYKTSLKPSDVIFTVGGAAAINHAFEIINENFPDCRILTPRPFYTLYNNKINRLYAFDLMSQPGYRLNAEIIERSILDAQKLAQFDDGQPMALVFCEPNNPLGTALQENEFKAIAKILDKYKGIHLILDEAYNEMRYDKKRTSLFSYLSEEVQQRTIVIRSGTKSFSMAGQRLSVSVIKNKQLRTAFVNKVVSSYGHAPIDAQEIYTKALENFTIQEQQRIIDHYQPQVQQIFSGIKALKAQLPDKNYKPEGSFYVLADLSDLIGMPMPTTVKQALPDRKTISTGEDITFYLMFQHKLMVAPFDYFGGNPSAGIVRITCSMGTTINKELLERINSALINARRFKYQELIRTIANQAAEFDKNDSQLQVYLQQIKELSNKFNANEHLANSAGELKDLVTGFEKISSDMRAYLWKKKLRTNNTKFNGNEFAATIIQKHWRGHRARKHMNESKQKHNKLWKTFVHMLSSDPNEIRGYLRITDDNQRTKKTKAWPDFQSLTIKYENLIAQSATLVNEIYSESKSMFNYFKKYRISILSKNCALSPNTNLLVYSKNLDTITKNLSKLVALITECSAASKRIRQLLSDLSKNNSKMANAFQTHFNALESTLNQITTTAYKLPSISKYKKNVSDFVFAMSGLILDINDYIKITKQQKTDFNLTIFIRDLNNTLPLTLPTKNTKFNCENFSSINNRSSSLENLTIMNSKSKNGNELLLNYSYKYQMSKSKDNNLLSSPSVNNNKFDGRYNTYMTWQLTEKKSSSNKDRSSSGQFWKTHSSSNGNSNNNIVKNKIEGKYLSQSKVIINN